MSDTPLELRLSSEIDDHLAEALSEIGEAFGLEGEWASKYGTDVDNAVFSMKPFSWSDSQDDPWAAMCDCDASDAVGRGERAPCAECPSVRFKDQNYVLGHGAPNFLFKPWGLHVTWYKYIGRSQTVLSLEGAKTQLTRAEIDAMKADCLAALVDPAMHERKIAHRIDAALGARADKDVLSKTLAALKPAPEDAEKSAAFAALLETLAEDAQMRAAVAFAESALDAAAIKTKGYGGMADLTIGGRVEDVAVRYRLMLRALHSTRRALGARDFDRARLAGDLDTALFAIVDDELAEAGSLLDERLPTSRAFADRALAMTPEDIAKIVASHRRRARKAAEITDGAGAAQAQHDVPL